ncbi:hypothetical protein AQPE_1690 [Aquipluma nitroreducens]|uniref:Uncharacterized protein n=1 Tax=Aquipluma nitroreducens TaxID=2010828 RepID=A0A5K7S886_9BACT|nr:hypothetical protein AQPE_1690 [Aquipluma nitroreducens]
MKMLMAIFVQSVCRYGYSLSKGFRAWKYSRVGELHRTGLYIVQR